MASHTNASLIKNHKGLERPIIPAHILNNATKRIPLNHSIYENTYYTFNLTEDFRLININIQPHLVVYTDNRSRG
jgi:hypothetical protein